METEIWKNVIGFENLYEVSNLGNVRNYKNKKLLKGNIPKSGHHQVILRKDGGNICRLVHRLVAEAFIENPNNFQEVDHIDTNRSNNKIENLRWISREDNMRNPNSFKNQKLAKLNKCKAVIGISLKDNSTLEFDSLNDAQRAGFIATNISKVAMGLRKSAGGYVWKFKDIDYDNN